MDKLIYIRAELNLDEHRCPIVPNDIQELIKNGYKIIVESSKNRIFSDDDYKNNGAIITLKKWYDEEYKLGIIIGLKELSSLEMLDNHTHVYFSHSYQNQLNSRKILDAFKYSNSIIYDFEYFLNDDKRRIIGFGYYAGYVGGCLGILQSYTKQKTGKNINNLVGWNSELELLNEINKIPDNFKKTLLIAVIGPEGNCGNSLIQLLDKLDINYVKYLKNSSKINLEYYDIIFNCIKLDENLNETWFHYTTNYIKPITIIDISCDYIKSNNPIKIYNQSTSWETPVYSYNKYVDIIAIDNLPSLLPRDSSIYFSNKCKKLLIDSIESQVWINNKNIYMNKI